LLFKILADSILEGSGAKVEEDAKEAAKGELASLDLSARSLNALKKAGIETVEKLQGLTEEELNAVKGLGEKSLKEIVKKLK